jgi:hypothetical protein
MDDEKRALQAEVGGMASRSARTKNPPTTVDQINATVDFSAFRVFARLHP